MQSTTYCIRIVCILLGCSYPLSGKRGDKFLLLSRFSIHLQKAKDPNVVGYMPVTTLTRAVRAQLDRSLTHYWNLPQHSLFHA